MQKDSKFKALMVQKISFMEVKTSELDNYSKKRDSLINLIKSIELDSVISNTK